MQLCFLDKKTYSVFIHPNLAAARAKKISYSRGFPSFFSLIIFPPTGIQAPADNAGFAHAEN